MYPPFMKIIAKIVAKIVAPVAENLVKYKQLGNGTLGEVRGSGQISKIIARQFSFSKIIARQVSCLKIIADTISIFENNRAFYVH